MWPTSQVAPQHCHRPVVAPHVPGYVTHWHRVQHNKTCDLQQCSHLVTVCVCLKVGPWARHFITERDEQVGL